MLTLTLGEIISNLVQMGKLSLAEARRAQGSRANKVSRMGTCVLVLWGFEVPVLRGHFLLPNNILAIRVNSLSFQKQLIKKSFPCNFFQFHCDIVDIQRLMFKMCGVMT